MAALVGEMVRSLSELQLGFKGELTMSEGMENIMNSLSGEGGTVLTDSLKSFRLTPLHDGIPGYTPPPPVPVDCTSQLACCISGWQALEVLGEDPAVVDEAGLPLLAAAADVAVEPEGALRAARRLDQRPRQHPQGPHVHRSCAETDARGA